MKKVIVLSFVLVCLGFVSRAQECKEIGFEKNNFIHWQGYRCAESANNLGTYSTDPVNCCGISVSLFDEASQNFPTSVSAGTDTKPRFQLLKKNDMIRSISGLPDTVRDPNINPIRLVSPNGSDYVVRLGNDARRTFAEKMSFRFKVTEETRNIAYYYAFVLEDPQHNGRPYFYTEVRRVTGGQIVACSNITFYAIQDQFQKLDKIGDYFYKNWSANTVDLSSVPLNEEVILTFVTSDCNAAGHFGYAYIDAACIPGSITHVGDLCQGKPITFGSSAIGIFKGETYRWTFGDGTTQTVSTTTHNHTYSQANTYNVKLEILDPNRPQCSRSLTQPITIGTCIPPSCNQCISSFYPDRGQWYVLSAWVKEGEEQGARTTYSNGSLELNFKRPEGDSTTGPVIASGEIIDGWQRIEKLFKVPSTATSVEVKMKNGNMDGSTNVYFDDLRVHPLRSNMKSFVYDPVNLKLMAELDENNYATLYEYDHEGSLVRVKKETERGVATIKESRNNSAQIKTQP